MPVRPVKVMIAKIMPYIGVGFVQVRLILAVSVAVFQLLIRGSIASAQQQTFAKTLPNGRIEAVAGVGHGVNLLQPQRCAHLAAEFWRSLG